MFLCAIHGCASFFGLVWCLKRLTSDWPLACSSEQLHTYIARLDVINIFNVQPIAFLGRVKRKYNATNDRMCECMYAMRQMETNSRRSWNILFIYMHLFEYRSTLIHNCLLVGAHFKKMVGTIKNDLIRFRELWMFLTHRFHFLISGPQNFLNPQKILEIIPYFIRLCIQQSTRHPLDE